MICIAMYNYIFVNSCVHMKLDESCYIRTFLVLIKDLNLLVKYVYSLSDYSLNSPFKLFKP